jgi:hypothetical protein
MVALTYDHEDLEIPDLLVGRVVPSDIDFKASDLRVFGDVVCTYRAEVEVIHFLVTSLLPLGRIDHLSLNAACLSLPQSSIKQHQNHSQ